MIIVAVVKVELHGRLAPQGVHMAASRGAHGRLKGCTWPPQGVHMGQRAMAPPLFEGYLVTVTTRSD